jgi:anti-sigma B factor antagonist
MNSSQPRQPGDSAANECDAVPLPDFGLEVTRDHQRVSLRASGEVDLATADVLEARISHHLDRAGARVVVDLRAVSFIDSSGIRALIAADQRARELRASLSFIIGGGQTRRVLELTGLVDRLHLESAPDGEGHGAAGPTPPRGSVTDGTL